MAGCQCVGSVKAHGRFQSAGGGSIPAPTLHYWIDSAVGEAQGLVEQFHYSHRWPSNVQLIENKQLKQRDTTGRIWTTSLYRWVSEPVQLPLQESA